MITSKVATIIQAVSPFCGVGAAAGAAGAAAASGAAAAAAAGAAATGALAAGAAAGAAASAAAAGLAASWAMAGAAAASATATDTPAISFVMVWIIGFPLQRFVAGLAGTDTDYLLQVGDENFAVADLAGARGALD